LDFTLIRFLQLIVQGLKASSRKEILLRIKLKLLLLALQSNDFVSL
jgi:hypothetical protein